MLRFFRGNTQPIQLKFRGNVAKAVSGVQRQIDGIEFDVRHRMQQSRIAFWRRHFAWLHLFGVYQNRFGWLPCTDEIQHGCVEVPVQLACQSRLLQLLGQVTFDDGICGQ